MANRTGTYFAFDGLGQADPTKSDFRYYATVQSWTANKSMEFNFVNSHDKAAAVRDTSKLETLKTSIRVRLAASNRMVIILSPATRKTGSLLSYEIEKAVDRYDLPLIVAYTGRDYVLSPLSLSSRWPAVLTARINNETAKAIHIPFRQTAILKAIKSYSVNGQQPSGPQRIYTREVQEKWGYL
ncbi:TIR domain-containing protein [Phaeobacter inhibens]|uniref:TIR domain-containing protein n=1 Tax=Phaeobacter inhibens TaxID=221822 RepID=UPI0026E1C66A|nr:TIR domain-containing protein [Phaeobacter inhibens]MDO6758523.1 TIR domain-containing protein [Phaeobacter inhibens]